MNALAPHPRPRRRAAPAVIRIELQVELDYEVDEHGADFVFNIHAAHTPQQRVAAEALVLSQPVAPQMHTDPRHRQPLPAPARRCRGR